MENVIVVGAGFMGAGIAQVFAQSGYRLNSEVGMRSAESTKGLRNGEKLNAF